MGLMEDLPPNLRPVQKDKLSTSWTVWMLTRALELSILQMLAVSTISGSNSSTFLTFWLHQSELKLLQIVTQDYCKAEYNKWLHWKITIV